MSSGIVSSALLNQIIGAKSSSDDLTKLHAFLFMDNEKIIAQLDKPSLLHLSSFLIQSLMHPSDTLEEIANLEMFWELETEAIEYCKKLESHQYLKFLQQIINTLAREEEEAAVIGIQLCLPVG